MAQIKSQFWCFLVWLLSMSRVICSPKTFKEIIDLNSPIDDGEQTIRELESSLSPEQLDRLFLFKQAVEFDMNQDEIRDLPFKLERNALLVGLAKIVRNELGLVYAGQIEVDYQLYSNSVLEKFLLPCVQTDRKLEAWWATASEQPLDLPERSIAWLKIENICQNVISFILKESLEEAYKIFEDQLYYEIDRLRLGGSPMAAGTSKTWLIGSLGLGLNWLVFLKKCIERSSPPESIINELRTQEIPRKSLVTGLATFMKVELAKFVSEVSDQRVVHQIFIERIENPCELVDRALSNWWWEQSELTNVPIPADDISWLTIENICQNLQMQSANDSASGGSSLIDEVFQLFKRQLDIEAKLSNYERRERMLRLESPEFSFWS